MEYGVYPSSCVPYESQGCDAMGKTAYKESERDGPQMVVFGYIKTYTTLDLLR